MKAMYKEAMIEERNQYIHDRIIRKIYTIKVMRKHPEIMEDYDRELKNYYCNAKWTFCSLAVVFFCSTIRGPFKIINRVRDQLE